MHSMNISKLFEVSLHLAHAWGTLLFGGRKSNHFDGVLAGLDSFEIIHVDNDAGVYLEEEDPSNQQQYE